MIFILVILFIIIAYYGIGTIIAFTIGGKSSETESVSVQKSSLSEGTREEIKHAISTLEQAYNFAQDYGLKASMISMYEGNKSSRGSSGFVVHLYTHLEYPYTSSADIYADEYPIWECKNSSFGVYLEYNPSWGGRISCKWEKFNKAVWDAIIEKHPDWKIKYIRADKSVIDVEQ